MSRLILFFAMTLALASGYIGGYFIFRDSSVFAQSSASPLMLDMRAGKVSPRALSKGWAAPDQAGTWSKGAETELIIELGQVPAGDLELVLELMAKAPAGTEPGVLHVPLSINGVASGTLALTTTEAESRHRAIIARSSTQGKKELRVGFKLDELAAAPSGRIGFGVRALSVRDLSSIATFAGSVDGCLPTALSGWAVSIDGPVPVRMKIDGQNVPSSSTTVLRPDLAPLSLPLDSGFAVRFAQALPPGASVEIMFPNGEKLPNSPCKI